MDWKQGPPVLVGERVLWSGNGHTKPKSGVIKWIGNIPDLGSDWCVGLELEVALPSLGGDGYWKERKLFECREKHGLLVPIREIQKIGSKKHFRPISAENYSHFKLDDSQLRGSTRSDLLYKSHKEIQLKDRYSDFQSKLIEESIGFNPKAENRQSTSRGQQITRLENQNAENWSRKKTTERKKLVELVRNFQRDSNTPNEIPENSRTLDSKTDIKELLKNMNEIAGYFKEIKEGEERFEKPEPAENLTMYDANETGHSKPKKLFSFLKWFNKKQKQEPNLKMFKDSSAASSPMFPRKETSSCESIDTLFSTQTVRSFAYIPPTQYKPSAPPIDFDKSSYENLSENVAPQKNTKDETEPIYDRRKKRKAPEPPRLSRENSLPTTLEHKKNNEEDFDGVKTYHRRTVSESFKDKKAGAYCHVQGKRKAPPPPTPTLYPNLEKVNSPYASLYKKKKPAPPPPDVNSENTNQQPGKDVTTDQTIGEAKKEKSKDLKDVGNEEKGIKLNQSTKDRLTKDASLSPLPSRPWYKRSHRDSTGSNIIRKDLLKGFDKKKNKETDDWMPEVGFPRRSLSTESHSKFNIFSKLEKTEDKKKEEKRKSQISILTNISELDREAAEIVRKEQAEEKKMMAANDAKYYSPKEIKDKINEPVRVPAENIYREKPKPEKKPNVQPVDGGQAEALCEGIRNREEKPGNDADQKIKEEKLKDKENNLNPTQTDDNPKPNSFSPNVLADLTNSSSLSPPAKTSKPSQNPSQTRLNYFNVQNKELNYLNEPWVCQKCTLENPGWRVFCEICSSVKPRFPFNKAGLTAQPVTTAQTQPEQEDKKAESPSPKTDNHKELRQVQETNSAVNNEVEKEQPTEETLDELRKRRMTFFNSKLETLPESDKNEPGRSNAPKDTKPTKIVKEIRDSVEKPEEENKGDFQRKKEEETKIQPRNETNKVNQDMENVVEEKNKESDKESKETPEQTKNSKVKPDSSLSLIQNDPKASQIIQTQPEQPEKVAEAYIITKTIVLEDIIVKKPERGRKVSASVQTKSSIPTSPKAVRPPPRTKKITFETNNEPSKATELNLPPESRFRRNYSQEDLEELTTKLTQREGLADFRANIETMPLNTEMNTVAVNRLLRKLETAINCGDQFVAAGLAKELALMKINCSVTRQVTPSPGTSKITIDLYIEDKISHQGPIPLEVSPTMTLRQLKKKIQQELGIPLEVQRWILGKKLATDDDKTLEAEGVKTDYCPLFLYLVAPDNRKADKDDLSKTEKNTPEKPARESQPIEDNSPGPKAKGWYYNYEEDHYSYCEDSEEEANDQALNKTKETSPKTENIPKVSEDNIKRTETEESRKAEQSPIFDLKSRISENEAEKELKFISANSVKQKVEKLNKTFAENAKAVKPPLRSSRSPETWKCGACNVINSPGKLSCLSCKAKKVIVGPNNRISNDVKELAKKTSPQKENPKPADDNVHYKALMQLQDADLVPNSEPFSCSICLVDYAPGEGVTLKDCLHTFCRTCLVGTVQFSEDAEVKCPYLDETYSCPSVLQQREIRALVPKGIFELHLAKSVKEAENKIDNAFHCKTPDCKGWCIYEDNVNEFRCPVCKFNNCLTCQAIHTGINCREYQERMNDASETDVDAKKTRDMLNEMVEKGEAMACPKCQVVLMKKWGCDWLRCSMCKTEICWVTRGFRWGPDGKGDTSGGCKCGVNGVKCHPKCNYCH